MYAIDMRVRRLPATVQAELHVGIAKARALSNASYVVDCQKLTL
jgi:hypothetical protein